MTLPNFVVIGAPKSGTTSLFYYLKQHPDIYLPVRKELHYFSYHHLKKRLEGPGDRDAFVQLCNSRNAYESHYRNVKAEKAIGEVSPSYLYYSDVAQTIKETLGSVKIIVLLRNSVEKAYSQYMHLVREQLEFMTFYDALMEEEKRSNAGWSDIWLYAESSLYSEKIKDYISVFGKENVKIILFDDLIKQTDEVMVELFSFLSVDTTYKCDTRRVYNRTGNVKSKKIALFFSKKNQIKTAIKMILPERIRIWIRLAIQDLNTEAKPTIDKKSSAYLANFFSKDISNIEKIIEANLDWKNK
ncbi:MAG: sulfotransferase [Candidatus Electrothrix sp. AUS3]|nr:sulfotransferase [Candidatus Electrothrix gigas]